MFENGEKKISFGDDFGGATLTGRFNTMFFDGYSASKRLATTAVREMRWFEGPYAYPE